MSFSDKKFGIQNFASRQSPFCIEFYVSEPFYLFVGPDTLASPTTGAPAVFYLMERLRFFLVQSSRRVFNITRVRFFHSLGPTWCTRAAGPSSYPEHTRLNFPNPSQTRCPHCPIVPLPNPCSFTVPHVGHATMQANWSPSWYFCTSTRSTSTMGSAIVCNHPIQVHKHIQSLISMYERKEQ